MVWFKMIFLIWSSVNSYTTEVIHDPGYAYFFWQMKYLQGAEVLRLLLSHLNDGTMKVSLRCPYWVHTFASC